ncbi:MAG: DUF3788 domain-containing protein [Parabacteroides sp.]|nr:DUF3788 domain-containing protein [Parabacteroides sp.]
MDKMSLDDPRTFPSPQVLKETLGASYSAFEALVAWLLSIDAAPEWNYYRDGHGWLGKMPCKKKNLGWIHVYSGYFILTCHFTVKHHEAIAQLPIPEAVKEAFFNTETTARLRPLPVRVDTERLPPEIEVILRFKKGLK